LDHFVLNELGFQLLRFSRDFIGDAP